MESWFVIRDGEGDAAWNMAADAWLLENVSRLGRPVLRFYGWNSAAASFGYFQSYESVADWSALRPLVRRPTGGGLVPHDCDWTYSISIPAGHEWHRTPADESYQRVHNWVQEGLKSIAIPAVLASARDRPGPGQCFAGPERHDLVWQGRKVAGAAQRRTRTGLLIQGSVQARDFPVARREWEEGMVAAVAGARQWEVLEWSDEMREQIASLVEEKYGSRDFIERR